MNKLFCRALICMAAALALLSAALPAMAQNTRKIELIDGDRMSYDVRKGADITRVIGNVIFKHEETLMYCDSAYLFDATNNLEAFGNIHIKVNDSVNLFGDSLRYDGNRKIAEIHKNVRMIDNQIELRTEHLTYDIPAKTARYYDGGKITDPENTLTSIHGFYYSDKKDFFFTDSVVLVNVEYTITSDSLIYNTRTEVSRFYGPTTVVSKENFIYCEKGWYDTKQDIAEFMIRAFMRNEKQTLRGDSIYYNRITGKGAAWRNVTITDSVKNAVIKGHKVNYDQRSEYSLATDSAMLIIIEGADSLYLHADTLLATFDTVTEKARVIYAYYGVRFFRHDLQGSCDSLVYRYSDSTMRMYRFPLLWTEQKQLKADTIVIQISNNTIQEIFLYTASFVIDCDDTTEGRYNQVKGIRMIGWFEDGELKRVRVFGNAETIYFLREESGRRIGINRAVSSRLSIAFRKNEIESITFLDQPEGKMYPENKLSGRDLLLRDFEWFGKIRPENRADIFRKP